MALAGAIGVYAAIDHRRLRVVRAASRPQRRFRIGPSRDPGSMASPPVRVPGGPPMPISAMAQIEQMPGVALVTHRTAFFGQWKDAKNTVLLLATDAPKWFRIRSGFVMTDEVRDAYLRNLHGHDRHAGAIDVLRLDDRSANSFTSPMLRRDGSSSWELSSSASSIRSNRRATCIWR